MENSGTIKDAVESEYIESAHMHGVYSEAGSHDKANSEYVRLLSSLKRLRESPDKGESALIRASATDDSYVKCWAATHLLPIRESLAVDILKILSDESSLAGFNAKMVLKEWRAGRLIVE